jgi:hypothetical protein
MDSLHNLLADWIRVHYLQFMVHMIHPQCDNWDMPVFAGQLHAELAGVPATHRSDGPTLCRA